MPVTVVSRLAWESHTIAEGAHGIVELPHVRGMPVVDDAYLAGSVERHRCWPNRAGILERGSSEDIIDWYPALAPPPAEGRIRAHGGPSPTDLAQRLDWFLRFSKSLSQIRGVMVPIEPEAPCCIVMTRGVAQNVVSAASEPFPGALSLLPHRLGEFPGGLQLRLTNEAWTRAKAYAGAVRAALNVKE